MANETGVSQRKFDQDTTQAAITELLQGDLGVFAHVIDAKDLSLAVVPDNSSIQRLFILGEDVFLVQPDGSIVLLLGANKADLILEVDGQNVAFSKLAAAAASELDWSVLGDVPTVKLNDVLDPGSAQPSAGAEDPVEVGDPLIGLDISPLLPFTEYQRPEELEREELGEDGGNAPGVTSILASADIILDETDGPLGLRLSDFISFSVANAAFGEVITRVTVSIAGLPAGTQVSAGQVVSTGPTGTLNFSGTLAQFNSLALTFPEDFSTESRTDFAPGSLSGTVSTLTNFLGTSSANFPVTILPEGDAEIDTSLPDTVPDETDAPITIRPVDLLVPRVTDLDGSESLETLRLTIAGLPAGSTLANLGLALPAGVVASVVTDAATGATSIVIDMDAAQVADIEAAYAALSLTVPADFSTANRSDLVSGTALPLTFRLDIQSDEDRSASSDTGADGTVTATRVVDIGFEEDIDLIAPRQLVAAEDDGVANSQQGVDVALQLDITIDDQDGSETADPSDPRFAASVSVSFNALPAGTTVNGGTLSGTTWTGTVAEAEALVLSFPGDFSGSILSVTTVTTPEGSEAISQGIVITPTPDVQITGAIFTRETDAAVDVQLSSFIDVLITDPTEVLQNLSFVLPDLPPGVRVVDGAGVDIPGAVSAGPGGTSIVTLTYDASAPTFNLADVTLEFPKDYSTTNPLTSLAATLTVTTSQGGVNNVPVTAQVPVTIDAEGDVRVDDGTLTLQETDSVVTFKPVDGIMPLATDDDGSESITQIAVVFSGLPSGARVSLDNGATFQPAPAAYSFLGTMAEYQDLLIELPRDFSTVNPGTTLFADVAAVTDEGGFDFGRLDITVDFELDVTITAPATITVQEDGNGIDGQGVTVDPGLAVAVTDIDGSEDTTRVEISYTDLPAGVIFSTGSFDAGTGIWSGTVGNANALTMRFPGDYSGTVTAVVSAISPEGRLDTPQTITVAPTGDVDFNVVELVAAETDAAVVVTPFSAWKVVITDFDANQPAEVVDTVTLTLLDLPAGVVVSGVAPGTITYDAGLGGTLVFTGTEAEYQALQLAFPADFSTESPDTNGQTIEGTLAATSSEDTVGQSTPVSLRITPEGDVALDATLPDTVPDESDAPTPIRPADLLAAVLTDADSSESIETLELIIAGLPSGSTLARLGVVVPAGAQAAIANDPATGAATLVVTLDAAAVGDVVAAYDTVALTLPADFSTANRVDLSNGALTQPLAFTVNVQTDEDQDPADDTPFDGTATATRLVDIGFELDVDLSAPAIITGVEDADGVGVTLALGIAAVPTDQDGSEDSTTVEIVYTGMPSDAVFNGGTFDPVTLIWTGTAAEAGALSVTLPENFSGTISSVITALSPEGQKDIPQVIEITPAGDIAFTIQELTTQETDGRVVVTPSTAWVVSVTDTDPTPPVETISSVTLTLTDLPPGVIAGGVPGVTISYDPVLGGTLTFTGSEAEYLALTLDFPADYSTESPGATGPVLNGTLSATSTEDPVGISAPVALRITPEGDVTIDDTLPDTVPDETDLATVLTPASLLSPQTTDLDGSEGLERLTLTITGLPDGSTLANLGITVPAGATASLVTDPANGSATLELVMDAANVADIAASYAAFTLTLPQDFSTANRADLTTGATTLPVSLTLSVQTDEDQDANSDTPTDGTATTTRVVDIGAQEDITLTAPARIDALEDNGDPGDPDLGVDVALGIQIDIDDQDGSETKDGPDPRFAARIDIAFTGLPAGTLVNGGTLTNGNWTGTAAEAEALVLSLPGDYNGTILSTVTVTTREGQETATQTIVVAPTPDIVISGFVNTTETDADLEVLLSDFISVTIGPNETLQTLVFDLDDLPIGVRAVDANGVDVGTIVPDVGAGTADFEYIFNGTGTPPQDVRLILPADYSTQNPARSLSADVTVTTGSGTVSQAIPFIVNAEGDVQVGDGAVALTETDAVRTFKPSDEITPLATDADLSESITLVSVTFNQLPAGTRFSTDNGATFSTAPSTLQFSGTEAEYTDLVIELPADFSTQNPGTTLVGQVTALTDEGGSATGTLTVEVDAEGDLALSGPGSLALTENDAPGVTDEDTTSQAPLQFKPSDALNGAASDADGSEAVASVDLTVNGLPAGAVYSTDNGQSFQAVPAGASFGLTGLTGAQYNALIIRLPDDFSTVADITGTATFTTDEALLAGETDTGPNDGIETGSFSVSIASEQDVAITAADITVIEDLGQPIPLNLDAQVTDIDGSESITAITVDFANLPAGITQLVDLANPGTTFDLTGPAAQWTGPLATLQNLAVNTFPTHFSGIVDITVTVDTNEGSAAGTSETFQLNVTPIAEPTITLSVDDTTANVDLIGADNFIVDEDTSFLLLIDATTPDQDGSEQLTEIVIENMPAGWVPDTGGVVNTALFEQDQAKVASAQVSGTTLTITLAPGVTDFNGALRVAPLADDDQDVETLTGADLVATVTSQDAAAGLPTDTVTASDGVDVDVDAIVDGANIASRSRQANENLNNRRFLSVDIDSIDLQDSDGSETISSFELTISVDTASDVFDPSDNSDLLLRVRGNSFAAATNVVQTGSTGTTVTYLLTPNGSATSDQFADALERLQVIVPQHFSGRLNFDGQLSWNETSTGDVENDTSDNFLSQPIIMERIVRPNAEADLTASVFVRTLSEVATGSDTIVSATTQDGSISGAQILTLLESTDDGSGPGQVNLFVGLDAATPDTDGSEQLTSLVIEHVPTDWVRDVLTGTTIDAVAFFDASGALPLAASELAKIASAQYDVGTGSITLTFVADVTEFSGSLQLKPSLYEDYDVDRDDADPFLADGNFFTDDIRVVLNSEDTNTVTTVTEEADVTLDVDVDPVNNFALISAIPVGDEGVIDAAGGIWQIPFTPSLVDTDGSETITAVVLRDIPIGITVYVPIDPLNPTGPKKPALLTQVNQPTGFNAWSLENNEWDGVELRGIPTHFAGDYPVVMDVITREDDGGGIRTTSLNKTFTIEPVADGGNPSERFSTTEDTAVQVRIDGNAIDNAGISPGSPEQIVGSLVIDNIQADSNGRLPEFFDGMPGPIPTGGTQALNQYDISSGTLTLTAAQAATLWVRGGKDSNEDVVFDVTVTYAEALDPAQTTTGTGTVRIDVTGIADDPVVGAQDAAGFATAGSIDAIFRPTEDVGGVTNAERIYGYAGFDSGPFELDSRLLDSVITSGVIPTTAAQAFTQTGVDPLSGVTSEILVPETAPVAIDGSETIYYLIQDVPAGVAFAGASPVDASGSTYLVTETQLAGLQFVPQDVAQTTYYDMQFTVIVVEDDQTLPPAAGRPTDVVLAEIAALPGGAVETVDFTIVVVPDPGGVGPIACTPQQMLPLPDLTLVGSGDEDTAIPLKLQITPNAFYSSINDLVDLPAQVVGSFGLGIDIPAGATLTSVPTGGVIVDPVTGKYVIDLAALGVDPADPTQTLGTLLFTPPPHESSPANTFNASETFGADDPYDGLDALTYSMLLNNFTCGTTLSANRSFDLTINPVADGPEILLGGASAFDEDTVYDLDLTIEGVDGGERPTGNVLIEIDGSNGAQLLDASGQPLTGTSIGGGIVQYSLSLAQIAGLGVTAGAHYSGPLQVTVRASSEDINGSVAETTLTRTLDVTPVADTPSFILDNSLVDADTGLPVLDLSGPVPVITAVEDIPFVLGTVLDANSPDQDGSEAVSIVLGGVPDYLEVTGPAGSGLIDNGDGTFTISTAVWPFVSVKLSDDHARLPDGLDATLPSEIPLTVTVNTLELANSDQATGTQDLILRIRPDADVPTLNASVTPNAGDEDDGTVYALALTGTTQDPHETMQFNITVPGEGKILVDGVEQVAVNGVVTVPGGTATAAGTGFDFAPAGVVTYAPPQDFAGTVDLQVVAVSVDSSTVGGFTDTATSGTTDLTITIDGTLDLTVDVDPPVEDVVQSAAPITIDLGITAVVTDSQAVPSETLEEVVVQFASPPPAGTTVSAGTLVGSTLTLTRGATTPANFALLVAALSVTVPGGFSGALAGDVTVSTNHGVGAAEAFSVEVNDLPVVSGPVAITSTEPDFFIGFNDLLANASDADQPLTVQNITSNDPAVTITVQPTGIEISVPDAYQGTPTLTYDVVDANPNAPATTQATADLDIDTLQMVAIGTVNNPDGVAKDLLDDVTGALGGNDIAKGTANDDAVILGGAASYSEIEGFDLMGGDDFIDLSAATSGFDVDLGAGADWAIGGSGADTLQGGLGADILQGGQGADVLEGGAGADIFVLTDLVTADVISDFDVPTGGVGVDQIDLTALVTLALGEVATDQVAYDNASGVLSVQNTDVAVVNAASGGFAAEVEVIFTNAAGAQDTAVI